jgi:hypothetical protein
MQILSELKKYTKTGISVWSFVRIEDTDAYMAVGGDDCKVIKATDRRHLRQIFENFKRYGYRSELPKKPVFIDDPWSSELPVRFQQELEMLSA